MKLRIGSRGSQLALWQANHIAALLRGQGHEVEIEIIKTTGDRLQEVTFAQVGAKGMFTKEIEEALDEGRIDLAVHSLKDLPTELSDPFMLAATPPRVDPRDVFVSINFATLASLPSGARVGTSSQRRRAQLKALRPDVEAVEFRGNVDTRLRKLADGKVDAILLAAAGLDRLEKTEWLRERLGLEKFCPAAGQGALGIETRKHDAATIAAVAFLNDASTRFAVTVERAALAALGGGCQVPIGIYCGVNGTHNTTEESCFITGYDFSSAKTSAESVWSLAPVEAASATFEVEVFAVVADPPSGSAIRVHHLAQQTNPEELGRLIAAKLIEAGAGPLLEAMTGGAQ
jgi:hydroxymethylbilane synthase